MQQSSNREKIELFISAKKILNKHILLETYLFCKVFHKLSSGQEEILGTTEVLKNNSDWTTTIKIDFIFEIKQELKFEVWQQGEDSQSLLGVLNTTLGEIVGSPEQTLEGNLRSDNFGILIIRWDKVNVEDKMIFWQWRGKKIKNMDGWFGKSDPFLRFFKYSGKDWLLIHQTEFCKNNNNPTWVPFEIQMTELNDGNECQNIKVECWDNEKNGKHQFIGETIFTLEQVQKYQIRKFISLSKKGVRNLIIQSNHGTLEIIQYFMLQTPTFLDDIKLGEEINLIIAIDFTGSNGDPKRSDSLHYHHPQHPNQYQLAISQISEILLNYNNCKQIYLYGFGGIPKFTNYTKNEVEHCFPLTGSLDKPEVKGIEGIMSTYSDALKHVQLAGPTFFAPVVQRACTIAQKDTLNNSYTILFILTDGETHDASSAISLIQGAAKIPLSIIIIGVGSENFPQMKVLERDNTSSKNAFLRNQVQFALFRDQPGDLAKKLLAEIPNQMMAFKKIMGLQACQIG